MGHRRVARAVLAAALVASLVQAEVTGIGGPGGPSPAAAATPPVGTWGFDATVVAAGTGAAGFSGDGGAATAAELREPADAVVSADGTTWYVADTWNNRVRAISRATGVITTVAGSAGQCQRASDPDDGCGDGGPAIDATLSRPSGVALSRDGTVLYIADTNANLIRAVTLATGTITTVAGTGTEGAGGDGGPATAAQLAGPSGVAAAPDGSVYVADTFNNRVRRIAPGGTMSTFAGTGTPCANPSTACGDGGPAASALVSGPVGVSVGTTAAEGVLVADTGNNRIRQVTPDGIVRTVAGTGVGGNGGDGGPATAAQLDAPERAVVGYGGALYIADTANHRIRVAFLVQQTIWPVAGTGTPSSGPDSSPSWSTGLHSPRGLAVTPAGIAVADTTNHVVRAMSAPHVLISLTRCGPDPTTPGGRYTAEIPLAGFPTPSFVRADVYGGAGGGAYFGGGESWNGLGGYAHQEWRVDPTAARLYASVGCQGEEGAGDGENAGGGGGGGASAIAALENAVERPLVIAGGGGGGGSAVSPCSAPDRSRAQGFSGGNGAQARGQGPNAYGGGGAGVGGVFPDRPTVKSGADGYGGPGGEGGYYSGDGGWGTSFGAGGAGSGGRGDTVPLPGAREGPCGASGGGGGGWGGGAAGDSATVMGGSGGGNYGVCTDGTQRAQTDEDGSITVEITSAASSSCTVSPPAGVEDQVGATREAAHGRAWSSVDVLGDVRAAHAALPAPQQPRVDAISTVPAPVCPLATRGSGSQPSDGQAVFYSGATPGGASLLVDTGRWDEATCPTLSPFGSVGSVALGPGVVVRVVTGSGVVHVASSGPVAISGSVTSAAVLEADDYLKLFNECQRCDLTGADLSGLTFPAGTDLTGATLSAATIYNTDLSGAVLTDAVFGVDGDGDPATISDSSLQGATVERTAFDATVFKAAAFEQAVFTCASFSNTVLLAASFADATWSSPSCSRPTFSGATLAMTTVPPARWASVSFDTSTIVTTAATRALAKGISLSSWTFTGSQFLGLPPDLSGITVTGAKLDGSSFMLADFTGATFTAPTSIQRAVFVDATLDDVKLPDAVGHGAVFTGANLEDAVFDGAKLGTGPDPNAPLPAASFRGADAHGASFRDVEARGVRFDSAYLYRGDGVVSFTGATLQAASFTGAVLGSTDFTNIVDSDSVRFDGAQCINCDFTGARMAGAVFDSAYVYGAAFKGATMANASFVNAACCATGTWSYSLGAGASASVEPYSVNPVEPALDGPEFSNVALCPSGLPPSASSGCRGQTTPGQPPPQPACAAAADHDCALDIILLGGTGTAGYSDGGPQVDAKLAAFDSPGDVAYDAVTGDAIVADTANRVVRRIAQVSSPAPTVSIVAGTPPAPGSAPPTAAPPKRTRPRPGAVRATPTLIAPSGVTSGVVNSVPTIGVADRVSHIVFTTTGVSTPRPAAGTGAVCPAPTDPCGDGGPGSRAELNAPQGVWFDPVGNLYVADTGNNRIRRVDTDGTITTVAGTGASGYTGDGGPARAAHLDGPTDVVGDRLGNLYVADAGNGAIRRIDPEGTIATLAGGDGSLTRPTSVTVDGRNRLYLADAGANTIATLNLFGIARPYAGTGTAGYGGDGGPALAAELDGPLGIAAVGDDTLFVADTANQRIRVVQPAR